MSASNRCAAEPFNFSVLLFVLDGLRVEVLDEAVRHRSEDGHGFGIIDFMRHQESQCIRARRTAAGVALKMCGNLFGTKFTEVSYNMRLALARKYVMWYNT